MASIKNLKKDINFLTNEVIETCMVKLYFSIDKDRDNIFKIVDDFVNFRNETICKINQPEKVDGKKQAKAYYKKLLKEYIEKVDQTFEKINSINNAKEEAKQ